VLTSLSPASRYRAPRHPARSLKQEYQEFLLQRIEEYKNANGTTINHFHEKLLLLKNLMNTATARALAEERHAYMEAFLARFMREWGGKT